MIFVIDGDTDYLYEDGQWFGKDEFDVEFTAASEHEVLVAIFEALRDGKTVSAVEN